ncbi:MAG: RteC domain-containing protein [Lutibacter sp.]
MLNYLSWTGTNTELVELFYGLNATGSINNGKAEMKKIMELCKVLFDIDLGNIYKTFDEIKTRKKDPTKFIDLIKTSLLKKLNAED